LILAAPLRLRSVLANASVNAVLNKVSSIARIVTTGFVRSLKRVLQSSQSKS
jgi:hypothetical protein